MISELDALKARVTVLEEAVKALQSPAPATPTTGASGTLTAPAESVPLDKPVSTPMMSTSNMIVTEGWVTPKDEPVNVRWDTRVVPETYLYKLRDAALVKGSKKDDAGFTWYRISNAPDSWVRSDVVTFSKDKPAPAPANAGKFPSPFVGYIVTNRHGINGHKGIDLATFDRTPSIVSAAMNGYVVKTALCGGCGPTPGLRVKSNNFGYGNFVIVAYPLASGEWLHALYGHLSMIHTMPQATLSDTSIIGNVGNSGDSSGNHLHLETRLADTRDARWATLENRQVDPAIYFEI